MPGSSAGLRKGDVWSLQDLLYGMLLVSGNDAALAIADYTGRKMLAVEKKRGSGIKRFVQDMRPTAMALGAKHSQFADPYGLSPSNVSTARDVGAIGSTVFRDQRLLPFGSCAAPNREHRRATGAHRYDRQHHRDAGRGRHRRRQDRIACQQEYLPSGRRMARAERANHCCRGARRGEPSRALQRHARDLGGVHRTDFPELAEPATSSTGEARKCDQ